MRRRVVMLGWLVGLVSLGALVFWWVCQRQSDIRYLPEDGPANWILYPAAVASGTHPIGDFSTVFFRSFRLEQAPTYAPLQIRAFRSFTVQVNGQTLASSEQEPAGEWKRAVEIDAGAALIAGENRLRVRVSNDEGPPALWLTLTVGDQQILSDSK